MQKKKIKIYGKQNEKVEIDQFDQMGINEKKKIVVYVYL